MLIICFHGDKRYSAFWLQINLQYIFIVYRRKFESTAESIEESLIDGSDKEHGLTDDDFECDDDDMIGHEFENLNNNNNNKLLYGDSDDKIKPSYYGHDDSLSPPSKFERSDDEVSEDEEENRGNKDSKKSRFVGNFFLFLFDEANNNVQSICIQLILSWL